MDLFGGDSRYRTYILVIYRILVRLFRVIGLKCMESPVRMSLPVGPKKPLEKPVELGFCQLYRF